MASFRPFVILLICCRSFFKLVINCVHISTTVPPKSQTQDASHIRIKSDRDIWRESCPERAPFSNRGSHIDWSVSLGWGLLKPHTCVCSISGVCDQEVGLLSQFPRFSYFSHFSSLSKHMWAIVISHSYLTGVAAAQLRQHRQIWTWFKGSCSYFYKIENFAYGEIFDRRFSNPHPRWGPLECNHSALILLQT